MKLYFLGNKKLLKEKKFIAVIGSREMSEYGKKMTEKFVPDLVRNGYVIVSGMALGVNLGVDRIKLWANKFGYGSKTGVELPGEVDGIVPDDA